MSRDVITSLPEDVVQIIARYSDIADVFSLKQACRQMNRLTDSDYLWHQLLPREELPLDLSPFTNFRNFTATELHAAALRALKLRYNWAHEHPRVRGVQVANLNTRNYETTFDELRLLHAGSILVGVHRDRHSQRPLSVVSVYNLINIDEPRLAAHVFVPVVMKDFDACLDPQITTLILAATVTKSGHEVLEVYSIRLPLDTPTVCNGSYELLYNFQLRSEGLFHKVSLHGDYLASSILDQSFPVGGQSSQVLIANWRTGQQLTISPRSTDSIDQMDIRVLPPHLCIVAASTEKAHITLVPLSVISYGSVLEQPEDGKAKQQDLLQFPHATVPIMDFYDICISSNVGFGPYTPPTSVSLIVFPTLSRLDVRQSKKALLLRFAITRKPSIKASPEADAECSASLDTEDLRASAIHLDRSIAFDIPVGSYPEYPSLGTTGRRGVWIEQSLKSDYVQILRLDFDPGTDQAPSLGILLPPEPQLPFKPSSCRALAFDEATGRLCVGLYNGLLYILDYV